MLTSGVSIRVEVIVVVVVVEAASHVVLDPRMLCIEVLVRVVVQFESLSSNSNAGSAIELGQGWVPGMPWLRVGANLHFEDFSLSSKSKGKHEHIVEVLAVEGM